MSARPSEIPKSPEKIIRLPVNHYELEIFFSNYRLQKRRAITKPGKLQISHRLINNGLRFTQLITSKRNEIMVKKITTSINDQNDQ